ncbi:molybdopterin converting factor subunit 1 [Cupriavidus sp. 2TAF22]|uniref:molybdopterin converting factor subunit 1 n=1 Tax=unclassified Cupriavidus TaxID=2640874 RepID=UPI003F93C969
MKLHLKYFASIREAAGLGEETLDAPASVATVLDLRVHLASRGGAIGDALRDDRPVRVALNQAVCTMQSRLRSGDEVALFPPVTGG